MEIPASPKSIKMTFAVPVELAQALDSERLRLTEQMRTRLSANQTLVRVMRLGIEVSANAS